MGYSLNFITGIEGATKLHGCLCLHLLPSSIAGWGPRRHCPLRKAVLGGLWGLWGRPCPKQDSEHTNPSQLSFARDGRNETEIVLAVVVPLSVLGGLWGPAASVKDWRRAALVLLDY